MSNKMIIHAISAVLALNLVNITPALAQNAETLASTDNMQNVPAPEGMEKCYGVAKAGMNDCGTASHSCAGESKTNNDQRDWIQTPKGLCSKIAGSSLAPEKM
jgi:uncharacterized membrane protein